MDITLSNASLPQLKARIADNEARGWHVVSAIRSHEYEMKSWENDRGHAVYGYHGSSKKFYVKMRKVDEMREAQ